LAELLRANLALMVGKSFALHAGSRDAGSGMVRGLGVSLNAQEATPNSVQNFAPDIVQIDYSA
jgi:glycerate kinase